MEVILLATGEANKLDPLTRHLPAPMIPVANRPVMEYTIEMLGRQGIKQMLVSLHRQPGEIEAHFRSGQRWGIELSYYLQRDALGSAGALRWARGSIHERFLVMPADILIDLDIQAIVDQHCAQGNSATVVITEENAKGMTGAWYETGVYLFEPEVLSYIPSREPFDISSQLIPALTQAGLKVQAYSTKGYWNPLNTLESYQEAQHLLLHNLMEGNNRKAENSARHPFRLAGQRTSQGVWMGKNSSIHPSARILPPVHIGENCQIGKEVELGPNVVIGHNVVVDNGATIQESTILNHTYVGQLVNISKRVVYHRMMIDIELAEHVRIGDEFLLSSTLQPDYNQARRFFEAGLALILLVLLLPIEVALAGLALMNSGRVFETTTKVKRTGKETEYFSLLRFATRSKDGRTNAIGAWMEQWDLARLPELWNVVTGSLRFFGIHPLAPEEVDQLVEPWQERLRRTQAGLGGLWYVQGSRASETMELQVIDTYYLATRSWQKNMALLWETPRAWLRRAREYSPQAIAKNASYRKQAAASENPGKSTGV